MSLAVLLFAGIVGITSSGNAADTSADVTSTVWDGNDIAAGVTCYVDSSHGMSKNATIYGTLEIKSGSVNTASHVLSLGDGAIIDFADGTTLTVTGELVVLQASHVYLTGTGEVTIEDSAKLTVGKDSQVDTSVNISASTSSTVTMTGAILLKGNASVTEVLAFTIGTTSYIYDGTAKDGTYGVTITPSGVDCSIISRVINGEEQTNAGDYTATASISYRLTDGGSTNGVRMVFTWSIEKASYDATADVDDWAVDETPSTPSVSGIPEEISSPVISYEYSTESNSWSSTVPTSVGTYSIRATISGTSNYNAVTTAGTVFEITKAASKVTYDISTSTDLLGLTASDLMNGVGVTPSGEYSRDLTFTGILNYISSYVGFWGVDDDKAGFYVAFDLNIVPTEVVWGDVTVIVGSGSTQKTFNASGQVFDGTLVLYLGNEIDFTDDYSIVVEFSTESYASTAYSLDFSALKTSMCFTGSGYEDTASAAITALNEAGRTDITDGVADKTMYVIYSQNGYTDSTMTGEVTFDGKVIYSEDLLATDGLRAWYFSFDEGQQASDWTLVNGTYTIVIYADDEVVLTVDVTVAGMDYVGSGYEVYADDATIALEDLGIEVSDVIDDTMFIVYRQTGYTDCTMQGFVYYGSKLVYSETLKSIDGLRAWYFSFDDQASKWTLINGTYTLQICTVDSEGNIIDICLSDDVIIGNEVTYVVNDVSTTFAYDYGTVIALPTPSTPAGYQFCGWYVDGDSEDIVSSGMYQVLGDVTFTAVFEKVVSNSFSIEYDYDALEGSVFGMSSVQEGQYGLFLVTPETGKIVSSISASNDAMVCEISSNVFMIITNEDTTITVLFEEAPYSDSLEASIAIIEVDDVDGFRGIVKSDDGFNVPVGGLTVKGTESTLRTIDGELMVVLKSITNYVDVVGDTTSATVDVFADEGYSLVSGSASFTYGEITLVSYKISA